MNHVDFNDMEIEMVQGLNEYIEFIKADYRKGFKGRTDEIAMRMIEEFDNGIRVERGSKYLKVITKNSVHSFICYRDLGKFTKGDILKANSWRSPAKNFARGNIVRKEYGATQWTGA